ncbi:outer membrane protein [Rhodoplanes sp. Z2-YC6860]|uniref:outer membrane protein n=1 Tax=Rhodoplanes sp. Z2-YC6860 TaxID=674703 RepID=UPI00078C76B7|nr:outer membrane beta-barrel protein [Rhodoplanes sp. Z2-YC6860]AMN40911.1 porin [Rhodoplanes sp. Z2-YC6860]
MRSKLSHVLLASVAAAVTAQGASAADLPTKAPVYKAAPIVAWDWTGPYVGAYVGVGVSKSRSRDPNGNVLGDLEHTGYGFTGGGTIGYNYQLNWGLFGQKLVIGAEGDIGYFDTGHRTTDWDDPLIYNSKTSWLGTARLRAGLADGPNFNYITAGFAAANVRDINRDAVSGFEVSSSKTQTGWVVGTGVETMLGGGWSAKTESLYINLESGDTLANPANGLTIFTDKREFYTQRFGLNYQFGAGKNGPLPQTNWNGLFVGGVFGGASSSISGSGIDRGSNPAGTAEIGNNGTGFTAGGQIGYNWMVTPKWVLGVEGDVSWLGIDHMSNDYFNVVGGNSGTPSALGSKASWIATARGRIGYSTGPALLYATGGGAWVNTKDTLFASSILSSSKTLSGWTVGGGIETAMWTNWSMKTEYLYVDAGRGDTLTDVVNGFSIAADHKYHLFRSALTYRFGGNPLTSRY